MELLKESRKNREVKMKEGNWEKEIVVGNREQNSRYGVGKSE